MRSFRPLARALQERGVRYLVIDVAGANLHAHTGGVVFSIQDRDVFLPPDADNLLRAWEACEACGLELTSGGSPLDPPRDRLLAERVVGLRASTRASDGAGLHVDLTFVMAAFDFEEVWRERTVFLLEGQDVHVARLLHIVLSKAALGRHKDQLFLATHEDALRQLLGDEPG